MALVRSHNQKSNENMYDYTIRTKRLADQLRNSYGADLNPTVTRGIEKTMIEHFVRGITSYKTRARMEISEYPDLEHATRNALRLDTLQEQNSYLNEVICAFCNTKGHLERQCRKKQDLMDASNQMAQHGTALRCTKCNGVGHSHMHCLVVQNYAKANRNNGSANQNNNNYNRAENNRNNGNNQNNYRGNTDNRPRCNYCNNIGHTEAECRKKASREANNNGNSQRYNNNSSDNRSGQNSNGQNNNSNNYRGNNNQYSNNQGNGNTNYRDNSNQNNNNNYRDNGNQYRGNQNNNNGYQNNNQNRNGPSNGGQYRPNNNRQQNFAQEDEAAIIDTILADGNLNFNEQSEN